MHGLYGKKKKESSMKAALNSAAEQIQNIQIIIWLNNLRPDCFPQEIKVLTIIILLNFYQNGKLPKTLSKNDECFWLIYKQTVPVDYNNISKLTRLYFVVKPGLFFKT